MQTLNNKSMTKKIFEVSVDVIADFAELLEDSELRNEIAGKSDDDDVIVNVYYAPEDKLKVLGLQHWLNENTENNEEEDED